MKKAFSRLRKGKDNIDKKPRIGTEIATPKEEGDASAIFMLFRINFPLWATNPCDVKNMKLAESTSQIKYADMLICSTTDGYWLNPDKKWELQFFYNKIIPDGTGNLIKNYAYWHVKFLYNCRNIQVTVFEDFDGDIEISFTKVGNETIKKLEKTKT